MKEEQLLLPRVTNTKVLILPRTFVVLVITLYLVLYFMTFSIQIEVFDKLVSTFLVLPTMFISWQLEFRRSFPLVLALVTSVLVILSWNYVEYLVLEDLLLVLFVSFMTTKLTSRSKELDTRNQELGILRDIIPDLMMVISKDGKIREYKATDKSDLYLKEDEIIGYDLCNSTPEIAAKIPVAIQKAIDSGGTQNIEYTILMEKGLQYYEARIKKKNMDEALVMIRNVTEKKLRNEQKREEELIHQYNLKQDALSQMTTDIVHTFNNILTVIMSSASMLRFTIEDRDINESLELIQSIEDTSHHTRAMFGNMLRQMGADPSKNSLVDIHQIIADVIEFVSYLVRRRVRVETDLQANHTLVYGNSSQIYNSLLNLALNSKDAMPEGGNIVFGTQNSAKTRSKERTYSKPEKKYIEIYVKDTGHGIDKKTLPKIFEPFFSTKGEKGLGLGLAGVQRTIREHEGSIEVDSKLNKGTTFTISIPVADE